MDSASSASVFTSLSCLEEATQRVTETKKQEPNKVDLF